MLPVNGSIFSRLSRICFSAVSVHLYTHVKCDHNIYSR